MSDQQKMRDEFDITNLDVERERIVLRYGFHNGREWIPYPGGPLYGKQALSCLTEEKERLERWRVLWPKAIRKLPVVIEPWPSAGL